MAILINDTAPRNQYTATSGQTVFTVSFEFFENADLKVYKNNTLQTITTHYTVTGAGVTGGGSITLTSGATAGDIITIVRDIPVKRVTDFPTSGPFNISALNAELDKIIAMVQEREDDITRVVQLSETDTSTSLALPVAASRASKVLGFDATGNAIVMQELGNYRGNWASGTAYVLRDIVKDTSNASIYICVQAHTSSGSQPISTNPNAASWALLIDGASAAAAASSASAAASSASAAASSASAASGSASAASTSAGNASTSATNASNSASSASTSATNAANSASSASTSATNAANSATSASGSATTATTQASNASSSASAAAASASTATTQASNASTSASNAASSASAAATSASNAASSASSASTSATSAAAARTAAESARDATLAAYDNFDDRYLGTKTSNPALDNDGNALVAGALYFNSVAGEMRLWTGSTWVAAYVSGAGFLSTSGGTITGDLVVNASGSTDGVRITQTGTGNALVVEDSANPDTTPIVIDPSGRLLVGTTSTVASTTLMQVAQTGNNVTSSVIDFTKERAGTTVIDGQGLGTIRFWGYDGTAYRQAASIVALVEGTPGLNVMPGLLQLRVRTATGTGDLPRLECLPWGGVTIGHQPGSGPALSGLVPAKLRIAEDTYTDTASAASATIAAGTINSIQATAVAATNTGVTYTNLSTLYIQNAPAASTNVTITNPWALYVAAGASYFGGQLRTAAGTAAAPAISTPGDTDTGIFFPAADTIALSAAGTEDFRIGPAGQIGIGGANYGTTGQVLTSGGAAAAPSWATVTTAKAITTQTFNSSGTWTKPSGYGASARVQIQAWGGGGGGGRYNSNNQPGGGGGGGAYAERWIDLASLGATETITIGAGGTAAVGNANGGVGGTTSVGSILSAYGGGGGGGNTNMNGGGGGGQISSGTIITPGRPWINFLPGLCGTQSASAMSSGGTSNGIIPGGSGFWGGGGGGAGISGTGGANNAGGSAYLGGGGGGGGATLTAGGTGGTGIAGGGSGGAGVVGGTATAGAQPGGGGGGAYTGTAAAGGAGRVIITVFDGV